MDTTQQYILRYGGAGPAPEGDLARIVGSKAVTVLDYSPPRMLLVRAPEDELLKLMSEMPEWIMTQERMIPLPAPYPKAKTGRSTGSRKAAKPNSAGETVKSTSATDRAAKSRATDMAAKSSPEAQATQPETGQKAP